MFDLVDGPDELHDLAMAGSPPETMAELRRHLVHELTGREEGFVAEGRLVPGRDTVKVLSRR